MAEAEERVSGGEEERRTDNEGLRAEEESAKAMEAEVPHPEGYPDPGQERPS